MKLRKYSKFLNIYNPDKLTGLFQVVKDGDAQNSVEFLIIVTANFTLIFVYKSIQEIVYTQLETTELYCLVYI